MVIHLSVEDTAMHSFSREQSTFPRNAHNLVKCSKYPNPKFKPTLHSLKVNILKEFFAILEYKFYKYR